MATAREDTGLGGGGKFKKPLNRPSRRTTPYDRPPTAVRNSNNINITNNNGWLSKLVNPAQRLITSSAHRLFASVFRKRLPPPPPSPLQEPETDLEAKDMPQEPVSTGRTGFQEAINGHADPSSSSGRGGLTELEQMLKQKTFTRSEIDQLTNLLRSRASDSPVEDEQKGPEVIPSQLVVSDDIKESSLNTPVKQSGIRSQLISTPVLSSRVLDEDIVSPTELAKAYMGSRPSKVSPSMLGLRGQAFREQSTVLSSRPFPSASPSPITSLVPRSSGHVRALENGFVTPRSRGRSALYSMARTPYTRVQSTSTLKGAGPTVESFAGPSPSSSFQSTRFTGSKDGTLKRKSSILDRDIGSVGPVRRIRQKSYLLSKNSSSSAYGSPISVGGTDASAVFQHPSSSTQKPLSLDGPKHSFEKSPTKIGDNCIPSTSYFPVPSRSSEMASKILQELDKLVSSREKPPMKLTPSMLSGPALKSLENVDSSILLENVQDNNKLDGSPDTSLPDVRDSTSLEQDKVKENGSTKFISSFEKPVPGMNGVDAAVIIKDNVPSIRTTDSALTNSIARQSPPKRYGFQMSAHEDYLDLDDDDDYSNGAASTLAKGKEKLDASVMENKSTAAEASTVEQSEAPVKVKPPTSSFNKISDVGTPNGSVQSEKSSPSASVTVQPAVTTFSSDKATLPNQSNAASVFNFGERVASPKESNSAFPTGNKVLQFTGGSSSSVANGSSALKFGAALDPKPESSTSFASVAAGATDSSPKVPESDKADDRTNLKADVLFKTPETTLPSAASTPSTAGMFSFGTPANSSRPNTGSLASNLSSSSSPIPSLVSNQNSISSSTLTLSTSKSSDASTTTTTPTSPSMMSSPTFNSASSEVLSTSVSPISTSSRVESTEAKPKDTSTGNPTSVTFGGAFPFTGTGSSTVSGTSSAITGTRSSIFGGTSLANTSTVSSIFGGTSSSVTNTGSSIFGGAPSAIPSTGTSVFGFTAPANNPFGAGSSQASVAGTGVATSSQSTPIQFGVAGNSAFSASSSVFASSTSAAKPFSSGPIFGLSSSTCSSESNSISSSSGTTMGAFGSSWQAPKTPVFGSTFNSSSSPSTGFVFGASSSSAATASAPAFASSTSGSSTSIFPFTSATAATSSQPVFGNANSMFAFGSTASNNNDQMTMEDSMAEDTVQAPTPTPTPAATPTVPLFGQQPTSAQPGFVFGTPPPSGANPFQFGGQQNLGTPQNSSPFQPTGIDFNAGGSFSLGTGGVDKSTRKFVKVKSRNRKK